MDTNPDLSTEDKYFRDHLTRNWWLIILRGLAAIAFGVLAFIWPGMTLLTLVYLFGVYALVNGVLSLILAFDAPKGYPRFGSLIFQGVISIAAGVIAFVWPGITALALLFLIAFWAIFTGVVEIMAAVRLRKVITHEWLLVLAGIASVVLGALLLVQPGAGALALIWWIGAFAIAVGILLLSLGFRMRHWRAGIAPSAPQAAA